MLKRSIFAAVSGLALCLPIVALAGSLPPATPALITQDATSFDPNFNPGFSLPAAAHALTADQATQADFSTLAAIAQQVNAAGITGMPTCPNGYLLTYWNGAFSCSAYVNSAGNADTAATADYATSASTANTATTATSAGSATSSSFATNATNATYANQIWDPVLGWVQGTTLRANATGGTTDYATNAGTAATAGTAGAVSGGINFSQVTGTIDGSRVTGTVSSAASSNYSFVAGYNGLFMTPQAAGYNPNVVGCTDSTLTSTVISGVTYYSCPGAGENAVGGGNTGPDNGSGTGGGTGGPSGN